MLTENYNIHDLIKIQINKQTKGLYYHLNPEFEYFQVDSIERPDIVVNVGKFKPAYSNSTIVNERYRVKKDYIYTKNKKYELEIKGLEEFSPVEVNVNATPTGIRRLWPILAGQNLFLRPLIEILAVRHGWALIHCAGISDQKKGYLLVGRPGVFKTSLTIDLLKKGMRFLGDENILVKDREISSYPLNIRSFVFKKDVTGYESVFGFYNRYKLFKFIRTKGKLNIEIQKKAILNKIYLVEKVLKAKNMKIKSINDDELTQKMIRNEKQEFDLAPTHFFSGITNYNFQELLNAYVDVNKRSKILKFWNKYEERIQNVINSTKEQFKICMPKQYHSKYGTKLYQDIRGKIRV